MIRIAVVDDEPIISKMIFDIISSILNNHKVQYKILVFDQGTELIDSFAQYEYELVLLDIDMPCMNGIETAKKIRSFNESTIIIFVTNKDEMVYEAIKFVPFRFIRKSRFDLEINEAIESFLRNIIRKNEVMIFSTENGKKMISVSDIIYVEVKSHKLTIHTKNEMIEANGNLKDVEDQGRKHGFIRIHQSYLVNFRFITIVNYKGVQLDNGELLPLGRGRYENVKLELMRFSREIEQ